MAIDGASVVGLYFYKSFQPAQIFTANDPAQGQQTAEKERECSAPL